MLTYRKTNIFFGLAALALAAAGLITKIPFYFFIVLALLWLALAFYGSYFVGSNFYTQVICSGSKEEKLIAISFDDGPDAAQTGNILTTLKGCGVEAAFFCIGKNIPANEAVLKRLHAEGHLIGNHSYSHHVLFDLFSASRMLEDMQRMDQETYNVLGFRPKFFRPPYGVTNPNLANAIEQGGYTAVGWTVRSLDTVIRNEKKLLERISQQIKAGDIVLFHDTGKLTQFILKEFIQTVRDKGFRIIRLDKLIKLEPYA